MAASDWQQRFTLRSAEVTPSAFPRLLDEVNEALREKEPFSCLMVDYWNGPGTFSDYAVGRQELSQRIADCVGGSAFGEVAEVRWRKIGSVFRVIFVAEADVDHLPLRGAGVTWRLEDGEVERILRGNDRSERSSLLWGSRLIENGAWVEARIPRALQYPTMPVQQGEYDHVRLHFVEYQDERGRVVIHRRTHLIAHLKQLRSGQKLEQESEENHGTATT